MRGRCPIKRTSRIRDTILLSRGEQDKAPPSGEGGTTEGLAYQGDLTQQQSEESLGQRAPKGSSGAESFVAAGFVLSMLSRPQV